MYVCIFCTVSTLLHKEKTGQCFSTMRVHIKITFSKKKEKHIHTHTLQGPVSDTPLLIQKYLNVHSMQNIIVDDGDTAVITDLVLALVEFTFQKREIDHKYSQIKSNISDRTTGK